MTTTRARISRKKYEMNRLAVGALEEQRRDALREIYVLLDGTEREADEDPQVVVSALLDLLAGLGRN